MHIQNRNLLLAGVGARGLMSARAEGAPGLVEIKALIEGVNKTFEEFKAANNARLAEMEKKGSVDPVLAEKVDKLNAAMTDQQKALDDTTKRMASLVLGGGGGGTETPEAKQHKEQFQGWLRGRIEARTTTYSDPDGGFLAPPTLDLAITRIVSQTVAMRRLAQAMTISGSSFVKFKSLGGASSGWVGESDTGSTGRPETSTPTLARMEFTPGEIYAEPYATQQALDDMAIDVEAWLSGEVAITFAEREGQAFLLGDGVKKPRGLLTYPTALNASYAWGSLGYVKTGAASNFIAASTTAGPADCLIDLVYSLKAAYRTGASWLANDLTAATMRKFRDGQGNYLWQPSIVAGQPSTFLGYAVDTDDNMPDVGANNFPVAFGNFKQAYLIVDRAGVRVLRNPYKVNGLVAFYTTKRVGGGVQNFEAVKLLKVEA
ncbi:MAG: phage major capsid protein [Rubritepida sp.]|nr:phage major capsid protein [Rubritepida sp.]